MEFSELIKSSRLLLGHTQGELCALVNLKLGHKHEDEHLKQGTLSAWETGRQVPKDVEASRINAVADTLRIDRGELRKLLLTVQSTRDIPTDYKYVEDIKGWVNRIKTSIKKDDRASIWMLNPSVLPAFLDARKEFEDLWKQNLEGGVNYFLIWDMAVPQRSDVFSRLQTYVADLSLKLDRKLDTSINIQLIHPPKGIRKNLDTISIVNDYELATEYWASRSREGWHPKWNVSKEPNSEIHELLIELNKWHSPIAGRLAVYMPPSTAEGETYASLMLSDVKLSMRGQSSNRYCWLGSEEVRQLRIIVRGAQELLFSEAKKIPV